MRGEGLHPSHLASRGVARLRAIKPGQNTGYAGYRQFSYPELRLS